MPRSSMASARQAMLLWGKREKVILPHLHSEMHRRRVVHAKNGKPKGLITMVRGQDNDHWAYYPKEEHIKTFFNAAGRVKHSGPSSFFPGAVGSIEIIRDLSNSWTVKYMQAHFFTGKGSSVNRALATKYGGWRQRILAEIFIEAEKEGKGVTLKKNLGSNIDSNSEMVRRSVFIEAAEKAGFSIFNQTNNLVASKKK